MTLTTLATLAARPGFPVPTTEEFQYGCVWHLSVFGVNACVNRVVLLMWLAAAIVLVLFLVAFRRPKLVPRGIQNVMEMVVDFIRTQIALEVIGPQGLPWVPFLTTMFSFILVCNLFEIIPGIQFPATSRMAIPLFLAVVVWFIFNIIGIRRQGFVRYFKAMAFPPGVPWPVYAILAPIEVVSTLVVRPFTLAIRLLANMVAGHFMLVIFFLGTAYLLGEAKTSPFAVGSFVLGALILGLEFVIDLLQAYIFTILTAVYISGALNPDH